VIGGCEAGTATGASGDWDAFGAADAAGEPAGGWVSMGRESTGMPPASPAAGPAEVVRAALAGAGARSGTPAPGRSAPAGSAGDAAAGSKLVAWPPAEPPAEGVAAAGTAAAPATVCPVRTGCMLSSAGAAELGSTDGAGDAPDAVFAPSTRAGAAVLAILARPDHCGSFGSFMAVRAIAGPPIPGLTVS